MRAPFSFMVSSGAPPFNPLSVPGCRAWYDAAHVTEVANVVTAIPDQSGNGRDATVSGVPAYTASNAGYGGRPTILRADITDLISTPDLGLGAEAFTLVIVGDAPTAAANFMFRSAAGVDLRAQFGTWLASEHGGGSQIGSAAVVDVTLPTVIVVVFDGASSRLYVSSLSPTTADTSSFADLTSFGVYIGDTSAGGFGDINFTHALVYQGAKTPTEAAYLLNGFGAGSSIAIAAAPVLVSLNFSLYDTAGGGLQVVAQGLNCAGVTAVNVYGTPVTPDATTGTTVTFTVPAHAAGIDTLFLTNAAGTSNTLPIQYWDPSQLTGINTYYDSVKGVTNVAGKLSAWADQSGHAYSATQATAGLRPTIIADSFTTGIDGIRGFADPTDGNDQSFMDDSGAMAAQTGFSYFAVMKTTGVKSVSTSSPSVSVPMAIFGGGGWAGFGMSGGAIDYQVFSDGAGSLNQGSGLNDGAPHLIGVSSDATPNLRTYLGSLQLGPTKTPGNALTYYDHLFSGYVSGPQDGFPGDVGAAITLLQPPSAAELVLLDLWAQQRFGTDVDTGYRSTTAADGYWLNYGGAPWGGSGSAGGSLALDFIAGSAPTVGGNFGAHPSADFDGTQYLNHSTWADLVTVNAFTFHFVVETDTASAPAGAGSEYQDPAFMSDGTNGELYVTFTTAGVLAGMYDGSSYHNTAPIPTGTGTKVTIQGKYDGTYLKCRVNGLDASGLPGWETVASGNLRGLMLGHDVALGSSYAGIGKIDGRIGLALVYNTALSDVALDALLQDARDNFGST